MKDARDKREQLAKWILLEAEALKTTESLLGQQSLAEELTKDAIALAKLVQEEQKTA